MTPKKIDWDAIHALYGAWVDRDDIDDEWLNRLRSSWDASYEAIMQDEPPAEFDDSLEAFNRFLKSL